MSDVVEVGAVLAARVALGYVYIYAGYLNGKAENRDWLLTHTALLFRPDTSASFIKAAAFIGVGMMLVGGLLVLVGFATWIGCATLIVFTLLGYWQHQKETEFATATADELSRQVDLLPDGAANAVRGLVLNLRISAYTGQLSSGLKNWGLIGALVLLGSVGAGALSLDNYLAKFRQNSLINLIILPM